MHPPHEGRAEKGSLRLEEIWEGRVGLPKLPAPLRGWEAPPALLPVTAGDPGQCKALCTLGH